MLDLSPEAGRLLDAEAERRGCAPWTVVDGIVRQHLGGEAPAPLVPDATLALEVARQLKPDLDPAAVLEAVRLKMALPRLR